MNKAVKSWFYLFGLFFATAMTIWMYVVFLVAFFNPSRSVVVTVDSVGEALPEFFLIPVCVVISMISLGMVLKRTVVKI